MTLSDKCWANQPNELIGSPFFFPLKPFFFSETHPDSIFRIFSESYITRFTPEGNNHHDTCHYLSGLILL